MSFLADTYKALASITIDLDAQVNPKTVIIGSAELWVGSPVEPIHVELGHIWDISASTNCASIDIIRSKVGDKFTFGTIASLDEAARVDVESVGNDRSGHCQRNCDIETHDNQSENF
ncbi:unnamed protein product [Fusarium graminearum]|nr:unnamed protein product [Fusarium graminearum]